jgi:hypothetical protein
LAAVFAVLVASSCLLAGFIPVFGHGSFSTHMMNGFVVLGILGLGASLLLCCLQVAGVQVGAAGGGRAGGAAEGCFWGQRPDVRAHGCSWGGGRASSRSTTSAIRHQRRLPAAQAPQAPHPGPCRRLLRR